MAIPATIFAILLAALPPCPTEDSANCAWDAQTMGDGNGTSFVDIGGTLYRAEVAQ